MVDILGYFDLNKRIGRKENEVTSIEMVIPVEDVSKEQIPLKEQIIMYVGVVIGVLFSPVVEQFKSGKIISLNIGIYYVAIAAIVALVIIPVVFEKLNVKANSPFIVRLGLFVQNGVFWQVLIGSISSSFVT